MPKSTGRKKKQREAEQRACAENGGEEAQGGRNVGEIERAISSAFGGALLISGLSRRSLPDSPSPRRAPRFCTEGQQAIARYMRLWVWTPIGTP